MPFAPRNTEVQAMLAVLEPDGLAELDEEQTLAATMLAVSLLRTAWAQLRLRDCWVIGHQDGPDWSSASLTVIYGVEPTPRDAELFARTLGFGIARVAKVHSAPAHTAYAQALQEDLEARYGDSPCARCGHRKVHHGAVKVRAGKVVRDPRQALVAAKCSVDCTCPEFAHP